MAQIADTTGLDDPGTKNSLAKMTWTESCMTPLKSSPQRKQIIRRKENLRRPAIPAGFDLLDSDTFSAYWHWLLEAPFFSTKAHHFLTVRVLLGHMSRTSLHDEFNAYYSTFQWSFSNPRVPLQLNSVHHTPPRRSPCKNMTSKTNSSCWTWLLNNDERNDGLIPARGSSLCAVSTLQLNDFALNHTELKGLPNDGSLGSCHLAR